MFSSLVPEFKKKKKSKTGLQSVLYTEICGPTRAQFDKWTIVVESEQEETGES